MGSPAHWGLVGSGEGYRLGSAVQAHGTPEGRPWGRTDGGGGSASVWEPWTLDSAVLHPGGIERELETLKIVTSGRGSVSQTACSAFCVVNAPGRGNRTFG